MADSIETPHVKIVKEEGILICIFKNKIDLDLDIAKHAVETRIAFSEGKSYPCLTDITKVRTVTKDARAYLADEGVKLIKAGALLVDSYLTKALGNFFLAINQPKIPSKLFNDANAAKQWLKKYL